MYNLASIFQKSHLENIIIDLLLSFDHSKQFLQYYISRTESIPMQLNI